MALVQMTAARVSASISRCLGETFRRLLLLLLPAWLLSGGKYLLLGPWLKSVGISLFHPLLFLFLFFKFLASLGSGATNSGIFCW